MNPIELKTFLSKTDVRIFQYSATPNCIAGIDYTGHVYQYIFSKKCWELKEGSAWKVKFNANETITGITDPEDHTTPPSFICHLVLFDINDSPFK